MLGSPLKVSHYAAWGPPDLADSLGQLAQLVKTNATFNLVKSLHRCREQHQGGAGRGARTAARRRERERMGGRGRTG
eukprot:9224235-Pyramimonas_sp.AAC.1